MYTVQGSANYGWPQCPAKWGFPPSPDDCADPVANFSAAPNPSPTIGGGYLVQGGPDSCLANWYATGSTWFATVLQQYAEAPQVAPAGPSLVCAPSLSQPDLNLTPLVLRALPTMQVLVQ